jgi:hypothetical protein
MKQATEFPFGKKNVFGRDIPLKRNGGLNKKWLNNEERRIYDKFLKLKDEKVEERAIETLTDEYLKGL